MKCLEIKTNYKLQYKIEIKKITYLIICPWLFQLQEHCHHDFVILNIIIIIPFHLLPYQYQVEILQFIIIVINCNLTTILQFTIIVITIIFNTFIRINLVSLILLLLFLLVFILILNLFIQYLILLYFLNQEVVLVFL